MMSQAKSDRSREDKPNRPVTSDWGGLSLRCSSGAECPGQSVVEGEMFRRCSALLVPYVFPALYGLHGIRRERRVGDTPVHGQHADRLSDRLRPDLFCLLPDPARE